MKKNLRWAVLDGKIVKIFSTNKDADGNWTFKDFHGKIHAIRRFKMFKTLEEAKAYLGKDFNSL